MTDNKVRRGLEYGSDSKYFWSKDIIIPRKYKNKSVRKGTSQRTSIKYTRTYCKMENHKGTESEETT